MATNKEKYIKNMMENTPFFHLPCYLDVTTNGLWDVALVEDTDGKIIASMPYYLDKSTKYSNIVQPHLSQFMGPWYDKSLPLAKVHKLIDQLFEQLPDHDGYAQNWHFSIDSWLPLYWKGYKQTTRYTYTIDGRNSEEDLWSNISSNIRRDIRKAAKEIEVVEGEPDDFDAFFDVIKKTFERKNNTLIYDKEIFKRLDITS